MTVCTVREFFSAQAERLSASNELYEIVADCVILVFFSTWLLRTYKMAKVETWRASEVW